MVEQGLIVKALGRAEEWFARRADARKMVSVNDLAVSALGIQAVNSVWNGSKFPGGLNSVKVMNIDYWTLRLMSKQLFHENIYARGLLRRLVTNEINTGLVLEATPLFGLLPIDEDESLDWAEVVETRFEIWANNPKLCDFKGERTFGQLQQLNRLNALISGDVLNVLRFNRKTGLPALQLIPGDSIQTPIDALPREGNKIIHGVEVNERTGRAVAFHVIQEDFSSRRIPAFGERSGRKIAWLSFGTERLLDGVRGIPFLGISMQALKEVDRIKDSAQRTAVIQSFVAMVIKKTEAKPGSLPFSGAATRRDSAAVVDGDGKTRTLNFAQQMPGLVLDELGQGEEPVPFDTSRMGVDFAKIEMAILQTIAWGNEIPPDILRMEFNKSHSASVAGNNEFEMYLKRSRADRVSDFCQPIQTEWLISEVLQGRIRAAGFINAWRDPLQFDVFGAWTACEWAGASKPRIDPLKEVKAYERMNEKGWITGALAARRLTNTRIDKNIRKIKKENEAWAAAFKPVLELKANLGIDPSKAIQDTVKQNTGALSGLEEIKAEIEELTEQVKELAV